MVLVHGDTSTTFVTALAAFYLQIPVGHVEAGLRTYNIYSPYPEEFNREAVGCVANCNFAPTAISKENLMREGKQEVMKASYLILTDSGGIQEEAPSLGKPVLVMRDTTERPEGIEAGTLKLVGTDEDVIYEAFSMLLDDRDEYEKMAKASNSYGDGKASWRIANVLEFGKCKEFYP